MKKILLTALIIFITGIIIINSYKAGTAGQKLKIGVSFSPQYATYLNLDWKTTYQDLLENLKVKYLRLSSPWSELEPNENEYNFTTLDYQIRRAAKSQASVLLVIGAKQPGWPECHLPAWAQNLTLNQRQQKTLQLLEQVVNRYKHDPTISAWQIENEPLFNYGYNCDPLSPDFLIKEVSLVRSLDPKRQIIVTDSGELSLWTQAMQAGDVFGTTMYRTVESPIFGHFTYPLPPSFYSLKSDLMRKVFAPENIKTIISELQAEPWFSQPLTKVPIEEQIKVFSTDNLQENIEFAEGTGFEEAYLWGAEWWYFMAQQGYPEYLEYVKTLF